MQTIFCQAENIRKTLSSQLISADARVSGRGQSIGEHGKEESLTGHDGMREIDGFLIDSIRNPTISLISRNGPYIGDHLAFFFSKLNFKEVYNVNINRSDNDICTSKIIPLTIP